MREIRTYGSEGGATQTNAPFLPLLPALGNDEGLAPSCMYSPSGQDNDSAEPHLWGDRQECLSYIGLWEYPAGTAVSGRGGLRFSS